MAVPVCLYGPDGMATAAQLDGLTCRYRCQVAAEDAIVP